VLTKAEIKALNVEIHRIERLSGVQMALVLVNTLPQEYDIEEYALLIGRKWHIGKNKNGLVYVAALKQRKQRLEVARNLVDKLTDDRCLEILDVTKPYFKQKDYNGGLQAMVEQLSGDLVPQSVANDETQPGTEQQANLATADSTKGNGSDSEESNMFIDILAWLTVLGIPITLMALFIRWIIRMNRRNGYASNGTLKENVYDDTVSGSRGFGRSSSGNYSTSSGSRRSGVGAALGGFAAGAATGYAARAIQDHLEEDRERDRKLEEDRERDRKREEAEERSVSNDDRDESDYGQWNSSSDSDNSSGSSSSNSGFDGGSGATSDW